MGLKYVNASEFEKGKEDKWPKHKAKASNEDKKEDNDDWRCGWHGNNNEQDDGEWIKVVKGSTNKIIKAATELQNDNTFIALQDDHGPRKTSTAVNNKATITTTPDATPPSNRTYTLSERSLNEKEKQDQKLKRCMHRKQTLQRLAQ